MRAHRTNLEVLRDGGIPKVDPYEMAMGTVGAVPLPDERAVLTLAIAFQIQEDGGKDCGIISWANQVKASNFHNANGLNATLGKIMEIRPSLLTGDYEDEKRAV